MGNKISLSDGEWKLMNLLWDAAPDYRTIKDMVEALKDDTGWTKATVNIMLTRLEEKGAVRVVQNGRTKNFYPLLSRDEAVKQEAKNTLSKIRTDGFGLLVSTMAKDCDLSEGELAELFGILMEGRGKDA